jgi:NAD-dependent SIR2 family protein deacetylase
MDTNDDIINKMKGLNKESLNERLDVIIDKINNEEITKVVFLLGAGISVASGIPDFRSDDGFYKTINTSQLSITKKKDLEMLKKDPNYILTSKMFESNQLPLLEVKRSFILDLLDKKYKPTLAHWFLRLCHERKILHHIYTQNIDNLESEVGIPSHKITQLHGTIGKAVCYFCNKPYPITDFYDHVKHNIRNIDKRKGSNEAQEECASKSIELICDKCENPGIKPDIVMFGEEIKERSFKYTKDADLLIVSGTSLQVFPANQIPLRVPLGCPRMVINNELPFIPDFMESDTFDLFVEGDCDERFLEFAAYLGWTNDLVKLVKKNKKNITPKSFDLIIND